jgi:hypothetical protein
MEKGEKLAKKWNLEGHSSSSNSFSILPVEEIVHTASDMGIVVKYDNFATFDLLKTLEMARDDLYVKQCGQNETSKSEIVETQPSADVPLRLEWLHDESSDIEDFILVESRKKKERKEKSVRFSPSNNAKGKVQENPGLPKKRGWPCKATSLKPPKEKKKK